ncbi:MAG: AAA family ATPase [Bacteroidota bacterium]
MQRIMIIGSGGSGKSTLARRIHGLTGLPLVHLDSHYWLPNWVEMDKASWASKVAELAQGESWVIDGNYGGTMELRLARADTVIFLDMPTGLRLWRVLKRVVTNYGGTRPDMGPDCQEKFSWQFMSYIAHYNQTRRPGILKRLAALDPSQRCFILRSPAEVDEFCQQLEASPPA